MGIGGSDGGDDELHKVVIRQNDIVAILDALGAKADASTYHRAHVPDSTQTRLRELLEKFDASLMRRWEGAWAALESDNPDHLSQAANSMVELLDQVLGKVCAGTDLATYLQS